jgi:uncharacterized protein (TIGR02147 family)
MQSVYQYTSYRAYLKDYYLARKAAESGYSFRIMAAQMGFASSNYLKLVMDGLRNLGEESIEKVLDAMGLKKKEREYFVLLIAFEKAKDSSQRDNLYTQICTIRTKRLIESLSSNQLAFYQQWYHPVVRELIEGQSHKCDLATLARRISPPISVPKLKQSVQLLLELKLITIDSAGTYRHGAPAINTADELSSFAVRDYHKKILTLAQDALTQLPAPHREFGALTARVSEQGFKRIKARLQQFRAELLTLITEDSATDRVVQISLQLFPVARIEDNDNQD